MQVDDLLAVPVVTPPPWPAIMTAQKKEGFKHFGMDLESLLWRKPKWRAALPSILFHDGDIVALGDGGRKRGKESSRGEK